MLGNLRFRFPLPYHALIQHSFSVSPLQLKAKLAKLRTQLQEPAGKVGAAYDRFDEAWRSHAVARCCVCCDCLHCCPLQLLSLAPHCCLGMLPTGAAKQGASQGN